MDSREKQLALARQISAKATNEMDSLGMQLRAAQKSGLPTDEIGQKLVAARTAKMRADIMMKEAMANVRQAARKRA